MRLKLFRAANVAGAMALIRDELGPDSLILNTRRVAGGVEVTAALEDEQAAADAPTSPGAPSPSPPVSHWGRGRDGIFAWHGIPDGLAGSLAGRDLAVALGERLRFARLPMAASPLIVTGPPGAGKTLTIARLATRLVMAGLPPMVITADGQRAGATEQLLAFTRVLGISLIVADQPSLLERALARRANEPVLIDSAGLDPDDAASGKLVTALAAAARAVTALVLPAGLDPHEAADLAAGFARIGATHLVATRLDLCRRLGGILAAAEAGGLALAEAGVGPGAADGLCAMSPAFLATRLLDARPHASPRRQETIA